MTILDQLADHAGERVSEAKRKISPKDLKQQALSMKKGSFAFEKALRKDGISFICECKKASPSKGLIAPEFPYLQIAEEYEAAGADCISVLTEPKWFLGSDKFLKEIADAVNLDSDYLKTLWKVLGVTYVAEFASSICKDAGYQTIALQIEVFAKITIMVLSLPVLMALLQTIRSFLI